MVPTVNRFKSDKLQKDMSLLVHRVMNKLGDSISEDLKAMDMATKFEKSPSSLADDAVSFSAKVVGFKLTYTEAEAAEADLQLKSYINELNSPNNVIEKIK